MEVEMNVYTDTGVHTELHRRGVEHRHDEKNPKNIVVKVRFSEELALQIFRVDFDHSFMLHDSIAVPKVRDGKLQFDGERVKVFPDGYDPQYGTLYESVFMPTELGRDYESATYFVKQIVERDFVTEADLDPFLREVIEKRKLFDREAELVAEERRRVDEEIQRVKEKLNKEYEIRVREIKEREAAAAAFREEMARWIAEHGSDRIRKAFADGYKCKRMYLEMRGLHELGEGFILLGDDDADYYEVNIKERSCPYETSLDTAAELKKKFPDADVRVVWLPEQILPWDEEHDGGEAIKVVRKDLNGATYLKLL